MCGIAGVFGLHEVAKDMEYVAKAMSAALRHRGPDDQGFWISHDDGIALIHRRLSIVDLSSTGHQPMTSHDGRFVIVFNGEIYNHREIRSRLDSTCGTVAWRGHSDTETLIEAIAQWGLKQTLGKLVGMFAFALWDRRSRVLHLVRDRLGEKPLYYGKVGASFVFASELKCLKALPAWNGNINRDAIALLMRYNYIPAPHCIYEGLLKLPAATMLTISKPGELPETPPKRYWSVLSAASNGSARLDDSHEDSVSERLESLLRESVRGQMEADVPLGAFLSGGIDSSSVVALMQAQSSRPIKTFSIGFHEAQYDEARYARKVAAHLHTDHSELHITPKEALDVVPLLPDIYDEPFADSSQIPTFLVSRLAKRAVTVSLSGDGGDELFGGYNRYFWGRDLWRQFKRIPMRARAALARAIKAIPPAAWDALYGPMSILISADHRYKLFGDKMHKLADIIPATSSDDMYRLLVSHWKFPNDLVLSASEPRMEALSELAGMVLKDPTLRMMMMDTATYLPDDILVKLDRASMAVSLESRAPFLDHRLVEYAWRIPLSMNIHGGLGKVMLRRVLRKYVPDELIERPKQGFAVPIDSWLRGPLRGWASDFLDEQRLRREGFLNAKEIQVKWREHLTGRRNWQYSLWCVLMFQQWLDRQQRDSESTA